jgi:hypothetical protein|tara:strand:- start:1896 stop:2027 length:132 start_codon:yes stop_codon:yes gene_type:complete
MKKLIKKIKSIIGGIIIISIVIMWLILLPFLFIFDRLFGKWIK